MNSDVVAIKKKKEWHSPNEIIKKKIATQKLDTYDMCNLFYFFFMCIAAAP